MRGGRQTNVRSQETIITNGNDVAIQYRTTVIGVKIGTHPEIVPVIDVKRRFDPRIDGRWSSGSQHLLRQLPAPLRIERRRLIEFETQLFGTLTVPQQRRIKGIVPVAVEHFLFFGFWNGRWWWWWCHGRGGSPSIHFWWQVAGRTVLHRFIMVIIMAAHPPKGYFWRRGGCWGCCCCCCRFWNGSSQLSLRRMNGITERTRHRFRFWWESSS
mmetsp:Transcript_7484/g.15250  ORF Transcript_7484/g.15250 Transcript_7484/m.15250 type:complete len:213 (+) Transcript_7484:897-1535(+)